MFSLSLSKDFSIRICLDSVLAIGIFCIIIKFFVKMIMNEQEKLYYHHLHLLLLLRNHQHRRRFIQNRKKQTNKRKKETDCFPVQLTFHEILILTLDIR